MTTKEHAALTYLVFTTKMKLNAEKKFQQEVPFVLLPDAIRAYIGARQAGHFEITPDGRSLSWMIYPDEANLKNLTKESASEAIKHYVAPGYKKCVIGERSVVNIFDVMNVENKHYHALKIHMVQDDILDHYLRENMVDCTRRFDDCFVVKHSGVVLNGEELRKQIALFQELGFLHLVGKVYQQTGILLNAEWFKKNVLEPMLAVYPKDLAKNTFKYMEFSDELDARINARKFELTEDEKASVMITENLEETLDNLYSDAYASAWDAYREKYAKTWCS